MKIRMTEQELDRLAEFLNRKYEERRQKAKRAGKRYSIVRFSKEVGLTQPTMTRYMKLGPESEFVEGMDTPILLKLWDAFGSEFMEALRGDAALTEQKVEEQKARRRAAKNKGLGD